MFTRTDDKGKSSLAPKDNVPTAPKQGGSAAPVSGPSVANFRAQPDTLEPTVISEDLTIIGNVRSKGKVTLDGTIQGDLHCSSLVVSDKGEIIGGIVADEVVIHGRVAGSIYGNSVELLASADVQGDIFHRGIGIERGTKYDGRLKYLDDPISVVTA